MLGKRLPNSPMAGVSISVIQKITMQLADHIFRERDFTGVGKEFFMGSSEKEPFMIQFNPLISNED